MPYISKIETSLPDNAFDVQAVKNAISLWLKDDPDALKLCNRFIESSRTLERHFILPPEELVKLGGIEHRSQLFHEFGIMLGSSALSKAVNISKYQDNNALIFTSCSFPSIPSIDAEIIQRVGMSMSTFRIPIFQYGCVGGVAGLSLASKIAGNFDSVSLLSVELCSLVFQPSNKQPSQLVGAAIFADGSACAVIDQEKGPLKILKTESHLLPDSAYIMGYDFKDNGWHLRLDKDLPQLLGDNVRPLIENFLMQVDLDINSINWWLFHPGSMKILEELRLLLDLNDSNSGFAEKFLAKHGNLSSSSVLFIIKDFMDSAIYKTGDKVVVMGIGPGLTVEIILLECHR